MVKLTLLGRTSSSCRAPMHLWGALCGAGRGKRVSCEAVAVTHHPMWHQEGRPFLYDSQGSQTPIVPQNQQNNDLSTGKLESCNSSQWTPTNLLILSKKYNLITQIIIKIQWRLGSIFCCCWFFFLKESLKTGEMSSGNMQMHSVTFLCLSFLNQSIQLNGAKPLMQVRRCQLSTQPTLRLGRLCFWVSEQQCMPRSSIDTFPLCSQMCFNSASCFWWLLWSQLAQLPLPNVSKAEQLVGDCESDRVEAERGKLLERTYAAVTHYRKAPSIPFFLRSVTKCRESHEGILRDCGCPLPEWWHRCWRWQHTLEACGESQLCGGYGAGLSGVSGREEDEGLDRQRPWQFLWATSRGNCGRWPTCPHSSSHPPPKSRAEHFIPATNFPDTA